MKPFSRAILLTFCTLLSALSCSGFASEQNESWPSWLGQTLQQSTDQAWKRHTNAEYIDFIPRSEYPKVWVLVSRRSSAYDTALNTLLAVYKQELSNATFRVFLLPESDEKLKLWLQQAEKSADLIYTLGSTAMVQVHKLYAGGKLPVVTVNAKDPVLLGLTSSYQSSGNNFAFTSLNLPADVTLSFLLRFKPEMKQLGILYAKSNTSAYLTQFLPLKEEAEKNGMQVVAFEVDENSEQGKLATVLTQQLQVMNGEDPQLDQSVLWLTGSSSLLDRVAEINAQADKLPLLTVVPEVVNGRQDSALMSVGVSFVNNANQAAFYGIQILRGNIEPSALPVGVLSPPDISISFQQAARVKAQIPFSLIEMASDIYAENGERIRADGMSMESEAP